MTHLTPSDISLFIGGLFLYGVRSVIGKWLVLTSLAIARRLFIRTEKDLRQYSVYYEQHLLERYAALKQYLNKP